MAIDRNYWKSIRISKSNDPALPCPECGGVLRLVADSLLMKSMSSTTHHVITKREPISTYHMLIPMGCLPGRLEGIVTQWFANVGTFDDVWALFFSTVYNRSFSVEYRFQKLAPCMPQTGFFAS